MSFSLPIFHFYRLSSIALLSLLVVACASHDVADLVYQSDEGLVTSSENALVEKAEQNLDGSTVDKPSALTGSLLANLLIANLALNAQEYQLASKSMTKAADESTNTLLIEKATRFALYAKKLEDAVEQGQKWIKQDSDNYLAYLVTSIAAVEMDDLELSTTLLTQMLELDSEAYAVSYRRMGEIYLQHPAGLKSLEMIKKLVLLHPGVAEAWMLQAALAQRLDNKEEMLAALDKVLVLDNKNQRAALLKLGALHGSEPATLRTFAEQFSRNNPKAKSFKVAYGRELLKQEQNELALEQFLSILETLPKDAQALNLAALVYHSLGDFENSAAYFKRHLAVRPENDQSRVYLASAYHQLGRVDEASDVVKSIQDDADRFNSYRQIAMHIEEMQGANQGITYLKMIEVFNEAQQIQLIADQAHMLARAKRPQEELRLLNEQLIDFPDSTLLRYQRALLYVELKNIKAHEKDMRRLLKQDSENAHYHNTLGYSLLLEEGRLDDARPLINKAHTLKPDDPYILDSKGWLEYKLGNLRAAILYLSQAFKIDPDPEIAAHLGEVHWSLGEQDKAKAIWLNAKEKDAESDSLNEVIKRFIK